MYKLGKQAGSLSVESRVGSGGKNEWRRMGTLMEGRQGNSSG